VDAQECCGSLRVHGDGSTMLAVDVNTSISHGTTSRARTVAGTEIAAGVCGLNPVAAVGALAAQQRLNSQF
jgi:hypothetical protein